MYLPHVTFQRSGLREGSMAFRIGHCLSAFHGGGDGIRQDVACVFVNEGKLTSKGAMCSNGRELLEDSTLSFRRHQAF